MASRKNPGAPLAELNLKFSKETKGTFVYAMVTKAGVEVGGVYLPKLLFAEGKPGDRLGMIVVNPSRSAAEQDGE